ncbi:MAG: PTS sugar transporter subunit IIB [Deltaproteobacteria bacterium]|nr:PTS sugar transporter subunit IIB [Deltaproteobacteria bacterium]
MSVVLVRVDWRLIHGQIIQAWVPETRADCLVLANDATAENEIQRSIMEVSVPEELEVAILPVEVAAQEFRNGRWDSRRVVLILADCADALKIYNAGVKFRDLNLGNLHFSENKKQVTGSVALDSADLKNLNELSELGVNIEARSAPLDRSHSLSEIIKLNWNLPSK